MPVCQIHEWELAAMPGWTGATMRESECVWWPSAGASFRGIPGGPPVALVCATKNPAIREDLAGNNGLLAEFTSRVSL
jgi:hypothetical protein